MSDEMIPYVVRPGDYLSRLAHLHGFDAAKVWDHPKNAELRERRHNPEVLATGDVLHIPKPEPKRHSLSVGGTNRFTTNVPRIKLRVYLTGTDGQPLANARYWVDGEPEPAGTSDGEGLVEIEVSPAQRSLSVRVEGCEDSYVFNVALIEPIDTDAGLRQRLLNLRYLPEDGEAITPERTREAVQRFQEGHDLEPTGDVDDATREALVSAHGS